MKLNFCVFKVLQCSTMHYAPYVHSRLDLILEFCGTFGNAFACVQIPYKGTFLRNVCTIRS